MPTQEEQLEIVLGSEYSSDPSRLAWDIENQLCHYGMVWRVYKWPEV